MLYLETFSRVIHYFQTIFLKKRHMLWLRLLPFFLIIHTTELLCETIDTFYGPIEIEEPILLELIHSPAFERLRHIHQYGIAYFMKTYPEKYTRYEHSLGVFAILRTKKASLEEQIAGLLHDISHTAFSHVGDWVFAKEQQEEDYQTMIHHSYLVDSGIEKILNHYGYTVQQISPKRKEFTMLEQPLPNLCADRIDYNIQGAYYQKFITFEEALKLFLDLSFEEGKWIVGEKELAAKLAYFSLFMTEHCWGSASNCIASQWLADAILESIKIGAISWHEFHFGIDQIIWDRLSSSQNPFIQNRMEMIQSPDAYCCLVHPAQANMFIKFKCRGIDPWIRQGDEIIRLTSIHEELKEELERIKKQSLEGWPIEIRVP